MSLLKHILPVTFVSRIKLLVTLLLEMNSPFSSESLSGYSTLSLVAPYFTPSFRIYKCTGKSQFEENTTRCLSKCFYYNVRKKEIPTRAKT